MTDVRINGRGGQGAVTASRLLAEAAILEGQYVHA
ncbi:MAG: pyruvate ferredoxin oxidoreductase, partial [Candidatus Heimdallarchaeota archaeon]|nr:pyruvate ferredoxin oxidoreductase [Candidatus Heimdallarchaeota archaeon]